MLQRQSKRLRILSQLQRHRLGSKVEHHDNKNEHNDDHGDHHDHDHGHHHHVYDWRDDPNINLNLEVDARGIGFDPKSYVSPYVHHQDPNHDDWDLRALYKGYDHYDLSINHRPEKRLPELHNKMSAGIDDKEHAIEHLADYESEDADFQPDTFSSQHFRHKGPMTGFFIIGILPILFFSNEFFFNHYPDEDYWRISRPPPLDYPDVDDTDDTETFQDYQTLTIKRAVDSGQVAELWYDIKDGVKVYNKWSGVNQPMPLI